MSRVFILSFCPEKKWNSRPFLLNCNMFFSKTIFLNYRLKWIGNLSKVVCSKFCNFYANHSPQTMLRNVRCSKNLKNSTGKKIFKNCLIPNLFKTFDCVFTDIRTSIVIWYMSSPSWGPRTKLLGHSQAWSSKTMSKLISTNSHPKWPLS